MVWAKRTFHCREERCGRVVVRDVTVIGVSGVADRAGPTEICRRVGHDLDTVAQAAREFGVGWVCAHQSVIDYGDALIAADQRVEWTSVGGR